MLTRPNFLLPRPLGGVAATIAILISACSRDNGGHSSQSVGGDSGTGQTTTGGTSITTYGNVSHAVRDDYQAVCERRHACGALEGLRDGSVSACVENFTQPCQQEFIMQLYPEGAFESVLERCGPEIPTLSCEVFQGRSSTLEAFFPGCLESLLSINITGKTAVAHGQSCTRRAHTCEEGTYCTAEDDTSCGTCEARATEGESCAGNVPCAGDLACTAEVCVALLRDGSPCPFGRNSTCLSGPCDNNVCQPEPSEGEACDTFRICADSLFCDGTTCQHRKLRGAACEERRECQSDLACWEGRCWSDYGTCTPGRPGDQCSVTGECEEELVCNLQTLHCEPGIALGEFCAATDGSRCKPHLKCVNDLCSAPAANGEACTSDRQCESNRCEEDQCEGKKIGRLCDEDDDCESGECIELGHLRRICGPLPVCQ